MCLRRDFFQCPINLKPILLVLARAKHGLGVAAYARGFGSIGINQGYFAPTYPQIRDIFYPTVEEVAADWGLNVKINEGNKEVHFYYGRQ